MYFFYSYMNMVNDAGYNFHVERSIGCIPAMNGYNKKSQAKHKLNLR